MYIPDPIEIMDAQIERMCDEFNNIHCMSCGKETDEFYPMYNHPAAPAVCGECAQYNRDDLQNDTQHRQ